MPEFSRISNARLDTTAEPLQRLFREVVKHYDCSILWGHRDQAAQEAFYSLGLTQVRYPNSKHNTLPALAVDVTPYLNGSASFDPDQCRHFAGFVLGVAIMLNIPIRWGGDWDGDRDMTDQAFNDLLHFELLVAP